MKVALVTLRVFALSQDAREPFQGRQITFVFLIVVSTLAEINDAAIRIFVVRNGHCLFCLPDFCRLCQRGEVCAVCERLVIIGPYFVDRAMFSILPVRYIVDCGMRKSYAFRCMLFNDMPLVLAHA